jgi:hypothetical protein
VVSWSPAASSLNLRTEAAQTPVSSEGKTFRMTVRPASDSRETGDRSEPVSSKAGAEDPTAGSSPTVLTGVDLNAVVAMGSNLAV